MKKGSTMIEVLIAVGISVVGLLALIQISTKSVNNAGYATRQAQASSYAAQAIEDIRARKTALGWSAINTGSACSSVGQNQEFNSCVTVSIKNDLTTNLIDQMTVNVEVSWSEAGRESGATRPAARQQTVFTRY